MVTLANLMSLSAHFLGKWTESCQSIDCTLARIRAVKASSYIIWRNAQAQLPSEFRDLTDLMLCRGFVAHHQWTGLLTIFDSRLRSSLPSTRFLIDRGDSTDVEIASWLVWAILNRVEQVLVALDTRNTVEARSKHDALEELIQARRKDRAHGINSSGPESRVLAYLANAISRFHGFDADDTGAKSRIFDSLRWHTSTIEVIIVLASQRTLADALPIHAQEELDLHNAFLDAGLCGA